MNKTKPAPQSIVDLGLPHRPPFVFVCEIVARDPGVSAECAMVFDPDDPADLLPHTDRRGGGAVARRAGPGALESRADRRKWCHSGRRRSKPLTASLFLRRPDQFSGRRGRFLLRQRTGSVHPATPRQPRTKTSSPLSSCRPTNNKPPPKCAWRVKDQRCSVARYHAPRLSTNHEVHERLS